MQNNPNKPVRDDLSVNALRAITGVFGTLFLCLVAISESSIVPLFFVPALAFLMKAIDAEAVKKIDDVDNWEGI